MRKHRPYTGLLLLASAIAVVLAPQCGLLGHVLANGLHLLVGATGTVLLTGTLCVVGLACLVPHGTTRRTVRWLAARRRRQVAQVVVVNPPRALPAVAARVLPLRPQNDEVRSGLKHLGYDKIEIDGVLAQLDRSASTELQLRGALKLLRKAS